MQVQLDAPGLATGFEQPKIRRALAIIDAETRRDTAFAIRMTGEHGRIGRAFELRHGSRGKRFEFQIEKPFVARAKQCKQAVRRDALDRLGVIEIIGKFGTFIFLALDHVRTNLAVAPEPVAQLAEQRRIFGKLLEQNRTRAIQCGLTVGDIFLGADKLLRKGFRRQGWIVAQAVREWFEPGLARNLRPGATFRFVWQIQVLEPRFGFGGLDLALQFVAEFALFVDAFENRTAAFFEFAQITQALLEQSQLRIVETLGGFLAIARDERHGCAAIKQIHGGLHLTRLGGNFYGDALFDSQHDVGVSVLECYAGWE